MSLSPDDLQKVRSAPLFAGLDDSQLGCLDGGEIIELAPGTTLVAEGDCLPYFFLVLEGDVRLTRNYDRQTVLMGVIKPGNYTGETTLLLDTHWLATGRITKPTKLFRLAEEDFWHMLTTCRGVARQIYHTAANKMRNIEGYSVQREKLVSLGTMAAGLAHELNNPAAAARRAVAHLQTTTDKLQLYLCNLSQELKTEHWKILADASQDASERKTPELDHLARSDQEDAVAAWLSARGVPDAWEAAPAFVNVGLDTAWLEELTRKLPPAGHADALGWMETRLNLKALTTQIEQSTGRIAELVKAVKSYSYMDQSPMQEIDIHEGIENTVTMLGHKLKNVEVIRSFDRSIPRITAYGSELNQVWTNLIDNAIYAVGGKGKICISTSREDQDLLVEIVDNGIGIPPDVQPHLFEPFFTTKAVGTGTGLGLVISNRIIGDRHGGEIEFESRPGETRFKVRLPLNQSQ